MKINEDDKKRLRKEIENKLEKVPDGMRIHFDKDFLDWLIFDKYVETLNDHTFLCWSMIKGSDFEKTMLIKYPVWTGKFLQKIDLSELEFAHVMWNPCYDPNEYFEKGADNRFGNVDSIDFSNTNAKIDFEKSMVELAVLDIVNCNFSNTDLSNNDFDNSILVNIVDSILNNTGFKFCAEKNFAGLNVGRSIKKCHLIGCYVNGVKILSPEEKKEIVKQKRIEYEKYIEDFFNRTLTEIDEQILKR